ncbi:MAG: hypothetical protein K2Q18_12870 [Bdellovibrionales bacterium]|nr:hypothetical protein [Bdellovibrionales bacterium]
MKYIILMITVLICLSSCLNYNKEKPSFSEIDLKISEEWIYAEQIDGPKNNGEVMLRPPGVEQFVMGLTLLNVGGVGTKLHCVYYHIPYKTLPGRLLVIEIKNETTCPENSNDDNIFASLDNIKDLKVTLQNFKLKMEFSSGKDKKEISVTLPNLQLGEIHEKYLPLKEKRLMSGFRLLRLNDESFDLSKNKYLGRLTDRFSKGNAIRCQQVNKDCETISENRCSECRYGWYEVVDFQCPQGGSKFCGQNHCGEKNEPACPRGIKVVGPEEAGICQSDLEPVANGDKILVCQ